MSILDLAVTLVLYGLVFWVLWWAFSKLPANIEPFRTIILVLLVLAVAVVAIGLLTGKIALIHLRL